MMLMILYLAHIAASIMFAVELAAALGWGNRQRER